jgi:hypothetical protein
MSNMKHDKPLSVSLKISGLEMDGGAVRLSVFKEKIDQLVKILNDAERQAAKVKQAHSNFKITELRESSAFMGILPFAENEYYGSLEAVELVNEIVAGISSEADSLAPVSSGLIKKIQEMCGGHGQRFSEQVVDIAGTPYYFDENLAAKAQKYLDKTYYARGEIKGVLNRVNLHDKSAFYLYTDHGEGSIACNFSSELLPQVKHALGGAVIAQGLLKFIGSDADPVSATIDAIDIAPDNYVPPTLEELLGIAPNISGEMEITQYIGNLRDEWERH